MTIGSLFSGAGGFELAATKAGMTPLWASEIEPYAIAVTSARFPGMEHLGDIRAIHGGEIAPVDVVCGGSPCQDMSTSSPTRGEGVHGERSGLFWEMIRVIKEMKEATHGKYPRFVVFENVPGALSCHGGEDFAQIVEAFASLCAGGVHVPRPQRWQNAGVVVGDGWSLAWRVMDSQYFGCAQRRKRVYLVLDSGSERAWEVLFEREGRKGLAGADGSLGQSAAPPTAGSAPGLCRAVDNHQQDCRLRLYGETDPLPTLSHKMGTGGNNVPLVLCVGNKQINQSAMTPQAGTLNCMHDQQVVYVDDGNGPVLRRLTPLECLRAQGYPDNWWEDVPGSDTARYRLMGNSVAIPVVSAIMRSLAAHAGRTTFIPS